MSSQNDGKSSTPNGLWGDSSGIIQSSPVNIPRKTTNGSHVRQNSGSSHKSQEGSSADSSFGTKRQLVPQKPNCAEPKRKKNNPSTLHEYGFVPESIDQNLAQRFEKDVIVISQESMSSSQLSLIEHNGSRVCDGMYDADDDLFDSSPESTFVSYETGMPDQSSRVSNSGRQTNGRVNTRKSQQSTLSKVRGGNSKNSGCTDDVKDPKKVKNCEYARTSREKKNRKMWELEELKVKNACTIEIYMKLITIYHKKIYKTAPTLRRRQIHWYPGNTSGQNKCEEIHCLLPDLDEDILAELGNGPYGTIVHDGSFFNQKAAVAALHHNNTDTEFIESSRALNFSDVDVKSDVIRRQRSRSSSTAAQNFSSEITSLSLLQTTPKNQLDKSEDFILTCTPDQTVPYKNVPRKSCEFVNRFDNILYESVKPASHPVNSELNGDNKNFTNLQNDELLPSGLGVYNLSPSEPTIQQFTCDSSPIIASRPTTESFLQKISGNSYIFVTKNSNCPVTQNANYDTIKSECDSNTNMSLTSAFKSDTSSSFLGNSTASCNSDAKILTMQDVLEIRGQRIAIKSSRDSYTNFIDQDSDDIEFLQASLPTV